MIAATAALVGFAGGLAALVGLAWAVGHAPAAQRHAVRDVRRAARWAAK